VTIGALGVGHVWHTLTAGSPAGTIWVDISGVGPTGVPDEGTNDILVDPTRGNALYVAGDSGVMVCYTCAGAAAVPDWQILGSGLPHARVNGLSITSADHATLIAWTHGRGAWQVPLPAAPLPTPTPTPTPPAWTGWSPLGGVLAEQPTACACSASGMDAFVVGTDGALWHTWHDSGGWHWETLGGQPTSQVAAVASAPGQIDVF